MPRYQYILPVSASSASNRTATTICLGEETPPLIEEVLKRIRPPKTPLNSRKQHETLLARILTQEVAIWTLCWMWLPVAQTPDDNNGKIFWAPFDHPPFICVQAYVGDVHTQRKNHEILFKLAGETVDRLIYHFEEDYLSWARSSCGLSSRKAVEARRRFSNDLDSFFFYAPIKALTWLDGDSGACELEEGWSDRAETRLLRMLRRSTPLFASASIEFPPGPFRLGTRYCHDCTVQFQQHPSNSAVDYGAGALLDQLPSTGLIHRDDGTAWFPNLNNVAPGVYEILPQQFLTAYPSAMDSEIAADHQETTNVPLVAGFLDPNTAMLAPYTFSSSQSLVSPIKTTGPGWSVT